MEQISRLQLSFVLLIMNCTVKKLVLKIRFVKKWEMNFFSSEIPLKRISLESLKLYLGNIHILGAYCWLPQFEKKTFLVKAHRTICWIK